MTPIRKLLEGIPSRNFVYLIHLTEHKAQPLLLSRSMACEALRLRCWVENRWVQIILGFAESLLHLILVLGDAL